MKAKYKFPCAMNITGIRALRLFCVLSCWPLCRWRRTCPLDIKCLLHVRINVSCQWTTYEHINVAHVILYCEMCLISVQKHRQAVVSDRKFDCHYKQYLLFMSGSEWTGFGFLFIILNESRKSCPNRDLIKVLSTNGRYSLLLECKFFMLPALQFNMSICQFVN